ncbi:MAG: GGDEF domain-containing protein, partial [Gemmatimonadota bacterium]
ARYGGEEFAVLLVDTPPDEAHDVLERLRAAVEAHAFPREDVFAAGGLTISAGIAGCSRTATEVTQVIDEADRALYAAKHAGRNRVADAPLPVG